MSERSENRSLARREKRKKCGAAKHLATEKPAEGGAAQACQLGGWQEEGLRKEKVVGEKIVWFVNLQNMEMEEKTLNHFKSGLEGSPASQVLWRGS